MDVSGGSIANGGKIIQWTNHSGTNQHWTLHQVSGNVFTVVNVNSGLCLDVPNSSSTQGLQLDQWTCTGGANQEWVFDATGSYTSSSNTSYTLVNLNSGLLAEVSGNSTSTGGIVDQWPANGGANQTWNLS
jgi:hypothetical protein